MGLNIKNDETYRLVKELAEATGESMTTAVTQAVREKLDRIKGQRQDDFRIDDILELARDIRERLPAGYLDVDHGDLLYDEHGLPK